MYKVWEMHSDEGSYRPSKHVYLITTYLLFIILVCLTDKVMCTQTLALVRKICILESIGFTHQGD